MINKRYWLRGLITAIVVIIIQTSLYLGCLPTEKGPYGFCGLVFAFPFGIIADDLLLKIPMAQLRIPVLIVIEIIVLGAVFSLVGYLYGKRKTNLQ